MKFLLDPTKTTWRVTKKRDEKWSEVFLFQGRKYQPQYHWFCSHIRLTWRQQQLCYSRFILYVNGQNNPPSLRFQGVTDNLNTLSSFIICLCNFPPAFLLQSESCYDSHGSDFLFPTLRSNSSMDMKGSSALLLRACTSDTAIAPLSQPYALLSVQKTKLLQKMAGWTVSDHVRTAISWAMPT